MPEPTSWIVVGLDDSKASECALLQALDLAQARGAGVAAVHVIGGYDPFKKMEYGSYEHLVDMDAEKSRFAERLDPLLRKWESKRGAQVPPVEREVRVGPPARVLIEVGNKRGSELLVVGNRKRSKLSRALLGSVAEDLLRKCKRTVLVVHETCDE